MAGSAKLSNLRPRIYIAKGREKVGELAKKKLLPRKRVTCIRD